MRIALKGVSVSVLILATCMQLAYSQQPIAKDSSAYKTIAAGPQYKRPALHQFLWGKNYRTEWAAPVKFPILKLDTAKGGLYPVKAGGGHQSKSLQLKDQAERAYKLHSVDKTLGKVLPEVFKNTFIEKLVNDEVSMSFPYAATSLPIMEQSAGIYHTNPQYVYLPKQPALDTFNVKFGNDLYLFEEKPNSHWTASKTLGKFPDYFDTDTVLENLYKSSNYQLDQKRFLKARLFDMLIGNWDRHEGQWAWGAKADGNKITYEALPIDKDQVYFKYDGVLLSLAIASSGMSYFQSFKDKVGDVKTFNYEERGIDRLFTNQLSASEWMSIANELKQALPDSTIEKSVKQLPPEIYAISGAAIISKLKNRREQILDYTATYYNFLAKEVEVLGTKESDYFEVKRLNDNITSVKIYPSDASGGKKGNPYYSREFNSKETEEIRLFGLSGKDTYSIDGDVSKGIKVRLIGGPQTDIYRNTSLVAGNSNKTQIYDNNANQFDSFGKTRLQLSADSNIHKYVYRSFLYDKAGFKPTIFYNTEDRLFVGIGYAVLHHEWRKLPFAYKQDVGINYSISQKAFSFNYRGLFPKLIGNWDVPLSANYDFVRWTNFYGLGNETILSNKNYEYNTLRSKEFSGDIGLTRTIGKSTVEFVGFYKTISLINDASRFINPVSVSQPNLLKLHSYVGPRFNYRLASLDDSVAPVSGYSFSASAAYSKNLEQGNKSFTSYTADLQLYIPLISNFSLAISSGAAAVTGNPEFYQYPAIGGGQNLRGFRFNRFRGNTTAYNSNELRYMQNVKSYLFNGKAGLHVFYDQGRVWKPSENSKKRHSGYGAGVLLSPFNFILADFSYGVSNEEKLYQLRLAKLF